MTDYIRRDTAIELMKKEAAAMSESFEELGGESGIYADAYEDAANMLQDMPAADVAEVVHGQWQGEGDGYADGALVYDVWVCSNCGHYIDDGTDDPDCLPKYCPNCGAKMDGGFDDATS